MALSLLRVGVRNTAIRSSAVPATSSIVGGGRSISEKASSTTDAVSNAQDVHKIDCNFYTTLY